MHRATTKIPSENGPSKLHEAFFNTMSKSKHPQSNLLGSDDEDDCGFKTNESYAHHYNEFRKKEILSHRKYLELPLVSSIKLFNFQS